MRKIYCILALICVLLIPLNAQIHPNYYRIKWIESSSNGKVKLFMTTSIMYDYAEIKLGGILGTMITFSPTIDVVNLEASLYVIMNNIPIPLNIDEPNMGKHVLLPIKAGDDRTAFLDIKPSLDFPKYNYLLKINFNDDSNKSIVSVTCALKII